MIALTLYGCKHSTIELYEKEQTSSAQPAPSTVPKDDTLRDNTVFISDKNKQNPHSTGWIYVPETGIDDVVLFAPEKPYDYYTYTDFDGNENINGAFFSHYMMPFGDGSRNDLGRLNTVFGHSFNDSPDSGLFSGLKYYRDEEFAKTHPYFYFSTWEENMAFEVVAVFEAHIDLPYIHPFLSDFEYKEMLHNVFDSSLYNYKNVSISAKDKIMMLSTCAMTVNGKTGLDPYTTPYRFVVMGKLVAPYEATKQQADFEINLYPTPPDEFIISAN